MILKIFDRFKVRKVDFFNEFQLSLTYDKFGGAFSFTFLFDPNNPDHKELACVSHYHECTVEENGEILLTGFAISQGFKWKGEKQLATISGYSKPGWFEDCTIPPEIYPLQSDGVSLLNIAKKVTAPWNKSTKYGIDIIVDPSVTDRVNKSITKSTASETTTIAEYLRELAQQKKVIISHDELGNLVFTQANTDKDPILTFDFTTQTIPGTEYDFSFDGQSIHSHITVLRQASTEGGNAGQFTIHNPYCPVVYRPKTVTQSSGDDIDTSEVAGRELAKELENIRLTINTDRWVVDGKILKPNNMIEVFAPELYIYKKSKFFIRQIDYVGNERERTATLQCVLPEVVDFKVRESIFKGINMHP
jgi:prophage tail gpP-like protein